MKMGKILVLSLMVSLLLGTGIVFADHNPDLENVIDIIEDGAGKSGKTPQGLLTAPGIQNIISSPHLVSILEKDCSLYLFFLEDENEVLITTDDYGICPGQADFVESENTYGVTWRENRVGTETTQIFFKKIDLIGQSLTGDIKLTQVVSNRGLPSIAWTGNEYGIAWQDARDDVSYPCPNCITYGNNSEIYFVRVDSNGNKIGTESRISFCEERCGDAELDWKKPGYYDLSWVENIGGNLIPHSVRLDAFGNII